MNLSELRRTVAETSGVSGTDTDKVIDATLDAIGASLAKGDSVTLPGFGTFEVRHRNARAGRNPQTGAALQIAASDAPAFKAGAALRRRVSGA